MMLLLFLDDIKSESELMRINPERLDCLRFLGYGLRRFGRIINTTTMGVNPHELIRNFGYQLASGPG